MKKLKDTDFSKEEINKLKLFAHKGIQSKSIEDLTNSDKLIINNTEILIEKYKDQKKTCMADQSLTSMNETCFNSFRKSLCPQFPWC